MITKQMLIDGGVSQETIASLDAYPSAFHELKEKKGEPYANTYKVRAKEKRICSQTVI